MKPGLEKLFIILVLVLVFSSGNAMPPTPVHASAPEQTKSKLSIHVFLEFVMPTGPICAGQSYLILVKTAVDKDLNLQKGKVEHLYGGPQVNVRVETSSSRPTVGTLFPTSLLSGWDLDANLDEALFNFKAKQAGSTVLSFKATWEGKSILQKKSIEVVDCDYEVKATLEYYFPTGPGSLAFGVGQLTTRIQSEDHVNYTGNGTFSIMDGSIVPGCAFSYTGWPIPVTITGKIDSSKQLQLKFAYSPTTASASGACLGHGVSGSDSAWPSHLPKEASFPAKGGFQGFSIPNPVGPVNGSFSVTLIAH